MNRLQLIASTIASLDQLIARSEPFLKLSEDQLNTRTPAHDWSIGQIFDHLVKTDEPIARQYLQQLLKLPSNAPVEEEVRFSLIGKFLIQSMAKPNVPVPGKLVPSNERFDRKIVDRYVLGLQSLKATRKDLERRPIERIRIQSPAAKFIRYTGVDTLGLVTSHGERHLAQAEAVLRALEPIR